MNIEHPLDQLFQTETTTTQLQHVNVKEAELVAAHVEHTAEKDTEDAEIDKKIDAVYDAALEAYHNQTAMVEILEPRYAARNAEVAANYLNIALNAAATRAKVKGDRKRSAQFVPFATNQGANKGTVMASREDILKMICIDADTKD